MSYYPAIHMSIDTHRGPSHPHRGGEAILWAAFMDVFIMYSHISMDTYMLTPVVPHERNPVRF